MTPAKALLYGVIAAAVAGAAYLARHAESTGKVGAVGFCFGGGVVNRLATDSPDIAAAAPYYGTQPPAEKVANIKAPLLLH
jgi:carboxymethylenebutenolidase